MLEFQRREPVTVAGVAWYIATAEDTILTKLEWAARSGSDRQERDVVDLLRTADDRLDQGYLDRWATEIGVADSLQRVRRSPDGGQS